MTRGARRALVAFVVVLVLLNGLTVVLALRSSAALREARFWVNRTHAVLAEVTALQRHLDEVDRAQRQYALTGNADELRRYEREVMDAWDAYAALGRLTRENPSHGGRLLRLDALLRARFLALDERLASSTLREEWRADPLPDMEAWQPIDAIVEEVGESERRLLQSRWETLTAASERHRALTVGTAALSLVVVLLASLVIVRSLRT